MRGTLEAPCLVRCLARSVRYTAVSRATVPAARTRVGSRDARMRRPRPSPPATRHPPPPAATAHAATAHAAPHRSSPPPHVPQVAALGKLLGIDCEALSKAEPSP